MIFLLFYRMKVNRMNNFVYILRCKDKTLYTGWTNNLENRIKMHIVLILNFYLGEKFE